MNKVKIHDLNGTDAITTTVERLIQELIKVGELDAIIHELIGCGALDRVINLLNTLKVMSVARAIDDKGDGYKKATIEYKIAFNEVVDMLNTKQGTIEAKAELPKPQRTDAKKCENCGHLVLWLKGSEKSVPVFAENVGMKEMVFNPDVHKTHYFNDCKRVKGANKANKFTPPDAETRKDQAELF